MGTVKRYTARLTCEVAGCASLHAARGMCISHYGQWRKNGEVQPIRTPKNRWAAGEYIRVRDPEHPNANARGWVLEHVKVMSKTIGRPMLPEETVHHKNGDKHDNRPENLELWSHRHPKGQRIEDKVAWAKEFLSIYDPSALAAPEAVAVGAKMVQS